MRVERPDLTAEKRRLIILICALVAVVAMMLAFRTRMSSDANKASVAVRPSEVPHALPGKTPKSAAKQIPKKFPLPEKEPLIPPQVPIDPVRPGGFPGDPEAVLRKVVDFTFELEPEPLAYLLYKLRTTKPDDPERANAPWKTQSDLIPSVEDRKAARHPLRGKWVKIIGTLRGETYQWTPVKKPGPSGVYQIYRNYVFDVQGKLIFVYTIYDQPRFEAGDEVETEGLFLKILTYYNRKNEPVAAPVVIAERLRRYVPPPRRFSVFWDLVLPLAVVFAGVVLVLIMLRGGTRGLRGSKKTRKAGQP